MNMHLHISVFMFISTYIYIYILMHTHEAHRRGAGLRIRCLGRQGNFRARFPKRLIGCFIFNLSLSGWYPSDLASQK